MQPKVYISDFDFATIIERNERSAAHSIHATEVNSPYEANTLTGVGNLDGA